MISGRTASLRRGRPAIAPAQRRCLPICRWRDGGLPMGIMMFNRRFTRRSSQAAGAEAHRERFGVERGPARQGHAITTALLCPDAADVAVAGSGIAGIEKGAGICADASFWRKSDFWGDMEFLAHLRCAFSPRSTSQTGGRRTHRGSAACRKLSMCLGQPDASLIPNRAIQMGSFRDRRPVGGLALRKSRAAWSGPVAPRTPGTNAVNGQMDRGRAAGTSHSEAGRSGRAELSSGIPRDALLPLPVGDNEGGFVISL